MKWKFRISFYFLWEKFLLLLLSKFSISDDRTKFVKVQPIVLIFYQNRPLCSVKYLKILCVAASVSYLYLSDNLDVQAFCGSYLSTLKETRKTSIIRPLDFHFLTDFLKYWKEQVNVFFNLNIYKTLRIKVMVPVSEIYLKTVRFEVLRETLCRLRLTMVKQVTEFCVPKCDLFLVFRTLTTLKIL